MSHRLHRFSQIKRFTQMDFLFIDTDSCVPSVASGKAESMDFMESCAAILIILIIRVK